MKNAVKQKLVKAYCSLVKKSDEKVTISALCKKADIARATFYLHYKDIDEFILSLRNYIIEKFRSQAILFIMCKDNELHNLCKKENFILSDYDIELLDYFARQTRYIEFAITADTIFNDVDPLGLKNEEFFIKNKQKALIFFNGYIPILYFGIINYEQPKFEKEINLCRFYYKLMLNDIKDTY